MIDYLTRLSNDGQLHGVWFFVLHEGDTGVDIPAAARTRVMQWARRNGVVLHTVVFYEGRPGPFDDAWYYRRGVWPVTELDDMLPVRDGVHLRALMQLPPRELAREQARLGG